MNKMSMGAEGSRVEIYQFQTRRLNGAATDLSPYRGKVMLIVNTASRCGLTPQYEGLQQLHEEFAEDGLAILGFPCNQFGEQEPGTGDEIAQFCQVNYGVSFDMFEKTIVNGPDAHPLYRYLKARAPAASESAELPADGEIQWNFTKFLVGREGRVVARFEPGVPPADIAPAIREQLHAQGT